MAAEDRSVRSVEMSSNFLANTPSVQGKASPSLTLYSAPSMELEEYRPSLADKLRVGYFSQDRSSQTEVSDIVQLKEMTEVLQKLVRDVENLKRSVHYAKHVLQADYENKLQERALDLYCRVNDRILDLEKLHEERIQVVRRSYRQQLADAISQVSSEHKAYYSKKSKDNTSKFEKNLKKIKANDDQKKQQEQQQNSLLEMMKMQMKEAQEQADVQLQNALEKAQSPSSVATDPEIYELRDEVEKLEDKVEDLMTEVEDKEVENRRLGADISDLTEQLDAERKRIQQLKKELSDAVLAAEQERHNFKTESSSLSGDELTGTESDEPLRDKYKDLLDKQKLRLEGEMEAQLQKTKNKLISASRKQVEDLQRLHDEKLKKQKDVARERVAETLVSKEKPQLAESEKDELLKKLQKLEKKQTAEINRLQKELQRTNKTWEMKVTILQQTLHALKDESFLRASLQRQAARLQYAAVMYASDGPAILPTESQQIPQRTFQTLPGIKTNSRETVPIRLQRASGSDTPFSEDNVTPAPPQCTLDEEEQQQERSHESAAVQQETTADPSQALSSSSTGHVPVLSQVGVVEG